MTGVSEKISSIRASGDQRIDGLFYSSRWRDGDISYATPTKKQDYGPGYGSGESNGFQSASQLMAETLARALDIENGNSADDGFSVEGFTALNITKGPASDATIRLAQTTADPHNFGTAWGYYPGNFGVSGDVWGHIGNFNYATPVSGNYAHLTLIHELGHTLGLVHGHENTRFGALPANYDSMEYSVMTYRSYQSAVPGRYSNESTGYAQTFMMLDIAALQYLYGADYSTNGGDTVYSWTPLTGETLVNGQSAFSVAGNRIFTTIWDGGGEDTYDLSSYETELELSLEPGSQSVFANAQLARLGPNIYASGNIYNALLFDSDPRSLIENAIGGSAADKIIGNVANNTLNGGAADDSLMGQGGDDVLLGQLGNDALKGGRESDLLVGGHGNDWLSGGYDNDILRGGSGADSLFGRKGDDNLKGGEGDDLIFGGAGQDRLAGNAGNDRFIFRSPDDSQVGANADLIRDFEQGQDKIDLSALLDPPLSFLGDGDFNPVAASVIYRHQSGETHVFADLDADSFADVQINLIGVHTLQEADFLL